MASNERVGITLDVLPGTFAGVTAALGGFNELVAATSMFSKAIADSTSVIDAMTLTLGVALAGAAWESAKAFGELERGMKIVQAVSGQTSSEISVLTQKANEFSVKYKMGIDDITAGLQTLGRAGLSNVNTQLDTMQAGLQAAKIQGMELNDALEKIVATTALLGGDLKSANFGAQAEKLTSQLLSTAMTAPIDLNDVVQTLSYSGGTAAAAGINIQNDDALYDYLGAISAFAQKGVKGSMAGTAMRAFFTKPASQDTSVVEAFNKLKMKPSDLWEEGGNAMRPVSEQIDIIHNQMEKLHMSTLDQIELWGKIVGPKMGQQMMKLDSSVIKATSREIRQTASATELANMTMDNFLSDVSTLEQKGQRAWRGYGEAALAWIGPVIKGLNGLFDILGTDIGGIPIFQQFVKMGIIIVISQIIQKLGAVKNLFVGIIQEMRNMWGAMSKTERTVEEEVAAEKKRLQALGLTEDQAQALANAEGKIAGNLGTSNKVLAEFLAKLNQAVALMSELATLSRSTSMSMISSISGSQFNRKWGDEAKGMADGAWYRQHQGNYGNLTKNEFASLSLRHGMSSSDLVKIYDSNKFQQYAKENQSGKYAFPTAVSLEKYLQENQKGLYDPKINPVMGLVSNIKTDTGNIAGSISSLNNKSGRNSSQSNSRVGQVNTNNAQNIKKQHDNKQISEAEKQAIEEQRQSVEQTKQTSVEQSVTQAKEKQEKTEEALAAQAEKDLAFEKEQESIYQRQRQRELSAAEERANKIKQSSVIIGRNNTAMSRTLTFDQLQRAQAKLVKAYERISAQNPFTVAATTGESLNAVVDRRAKQRSALNVKILTIQKQLEQKYFAENEEESEAISSVQRGNELLKQTNIELDKNVITGREIYQLNQEFKQLLQHNINTIKGTNTSAGYSGSFTNRNIKRRTGIGTAEADQLALDANNQMLARYTATQQALNNLTHKGGAFQGGSMKEVAESQRIVNNIIRQQIATEEENLLFAEQEIEETQKQVNKERTKSRIIDLQLAEYRRTLALLQTSGRKVKIEPDTSQAKAIGVRSSQQYNSFLDDIRKFNTLPYKKQIQLTEERIAALEKSLERETLSFNKKTSNNRQKIAYYTQQISLIENNIAKLREIEEGYSKEMVTTQEAYNQQRAQQFKKTLDSHTRTINLLNQSRQAQEAEISAEKTILNELIARLGPEGHLAAATGVIDTIKNAQGEEETKVLSRLEEEEKIHTDIAKTLKSIHTKEATLDSINNSINARAEAVDKLILEYADILGQTNAAAKANLEKTIIQGSRMTATPMGPTPLLLPERTASRDATSYVPNFIMSNYPRVGGSLYSLLASMGVPYPRTTPPITTTGVTIGQPYGPLGGTDFYPGVNGKNAVLQLEEVAHSFKQAQQNPTSLGATGESRLALAGVPTYNRTGFIMVGDSYERTVRGTNLPTGQSGPILQLEQTAKTFQKSSQTLSDRLGTLFGHGSWFSKHQAGLGVGQPTGPGFFGSMRNAFYASNPRNNGATGIYSWLQMGITGMVDWGKIQKANTSLGKMGKLANVAGGALGSLGNMFGPFEIGMMGLSLVMQGVQAAQQRYKEELEKINSQLSEAREKFEKAEEAFLGAYEEQNPNATQDQKDEALLNLYANGPGDRDDGLDSYRTRVFGTLSQIEINTRKKAEKENDWLWGSRGAMQKHFWSPWDETWGWIFDDRKNLTRDEWNEQATIARENAAANDQDENEVYGITNHPYNDASFMEQYFKDTFHLEEIDKNLNHYENWVDDLEDYSEQAKYATSIMSQGVDATGPTKDSSWIRTFKDFTQEQLQAGVWGSKNGINDYRKFEESLSKIPETVKTQIANSINQDPDFYKSMQRQMFEFSNGKLQSRGEKREEKILEAIRRRVGNISAEQARQTLILSTISSINDFVQNQVQPAVLANVDAAMQGTQILGLTNTSVGYTGSSTAAVHQYVMVITSQLGQIVKQKALENASLLAESSGVRFEDLTKLAKEGTGAQGLSKTYTEQDANQAKQIFESMGQSLYQGPMMTKGMSQEDALKYAKTKFDKLNTSGSSLADMLHTWDQWFGFTMTPYIEEQWAKNLQDTTGKASGPTETDKDKDKNKDKDSSKDTANKKNWVNLAICNKKEIPKLNVNLFKKPPNFTILNRNFKLRDVNVNTADDAKSIQNAVKNSIIEIQNRSNPKIIQDDAAEYDPLAATEGNTLPTGTKKTE